MMGDTIFQDADDIGFPLEQRGFRALFAQVVFLAVQDALGESRACGESKPLLKRKALNWINSPYTSAGSFFWYCSHLDLDSDEMRARINSQCGLPRNLRAASSALNRPITKAFERAA